MNITQAIGAFLSGIGKMGDTLLGLEFVKKFFDHVSGNMTPADMNYMKFYLTGKRVPPQV